MMMRKLLLFMVLMAMMMAVGVVGPAGDGERLVQVLCELGSRRQNGGVSHSDTRLLLSRSKFNWNSINSDLQQELSWPWQVATEE